MAIEYTPESSLVADPAEGGSFSASNNAELAGAQSFAAKAKISETAAATSETNSANSATASANSATASSTSATQSADSATASATSATQSATSATASATSATASANSATAAATSETNAGTSATTATTKASEASTSATNAATSETNAGTSATAASNSATAASTSATSASGSATTATTKASEASTSETNAGTSATASATSATASANSATAAATSATNAGTSETAAATSATNAATSATASANSATASAGSATSSSNSATSAATAQTAAEAARDAALASFDSFDDRYLGQKTSDPSTDNDGNALVAGTLYFNTTTDAMMVYEGSSWVAAYASLSGALIANNNLADLNNAATARTNIGLGTNSSPAFTGLAVDTNTLIVDSTNNRVGIKRGTPTAELDVNGTIKAVDLDVTGGESYLCRTHGTTNSSLSVLRMCAISTGDMQDGFGTGITFDAGDNDGTISSQVAEINAVRAGSDDIFNLELQTGDVSRLTLGTTGATIATGTSGTDRFKVDSSGNVGINTGTNTITEKLDVAGNIAVSGTVDGRDVAGDGTKLDGVEAGATADQTAAEIKTAYESNADTNAFTDADHTKLDGIEAGATADQTAAQILTAIKTVDGTGSGLDADLLDGQQGSYYAAQSNVETYINRSYVDSHQAGNLAVGWYTIAQNTGNRAVARFAIWDVNGGDHQSVIFYAAHHYGTDASNTITVLHNSKFSGSPFKYIRIKDGGTYDGAALQVYIDDSTNNVNVALVGDDVQGSGWDIVDFLPDATAPSEVSNWSSFTEKSKIDLDLISQGGIATTGEIYAGGDLSQYKVWHAGNDGSGSGLDADTVDGIHASQFLRSDQNDTSSGVLSANYLRGNRLYSNADGTTGYFFNDSGTRTAYAGGDFYIQSSVGNCYIYATNTYLGNSSGDVIRLRGNQLVHNGWDARADGHIRFNDSKKLLFGNGSDVEMFFSGSHFYIDLESGGNNMYIRDGSTTRFTFDDAGHFTATGNVTAYSDRRLKDDIQPIEGALEKVSTLSGNTYQRNDLLDKDPERRYAGVIAQEVEVVLPEAVSESEDGTKTVDYNAVIALLVESIKELKAEVEQLKGGS